MSKDKITEVTEFKEGEIDDSNFESILTQNIANESAVIYCEGHDYGGGKVFANITYKQVFDVNGDPRETEPVTQRILLSDFNEETKNYSKFIDISFASTSEIKYLDGLMKVEVSLEDENNNFAETSKIYYIIRDTILEASGEAYIYHNFPDFRVKENGEQPAAWRFPATINTLNDLRTRIFKAESQFRPDIYFTYKSSNITKVLKTEYNDFSYTLSYGLSPNSYELCDTIPDGSCNISDNFSEYSKSHKNENIFVRMNFYDKAGNSSYLDGCIPATPDIMNYTYDSTNETIKINLIDKSNLNLPDYLGMNGINGRTTYMIFYGKKDGNTPIENIELSRNSYYTDENEYDDISDPTTIKIDPDSNYVVCIITQYKFFTYSTYSWLGNWYSPLYILDNVSKKEAETNTFSKPIINYTKESNGINSGSFTINIEYTNKEDGVVYYPAWSTDGTNYSYYESDATSIVVPASITPPRGDYLTDFKTKTSLESGWKNNKEYSPPTDTYNCKAYLKVLGVKGTTTIESDPVEINFSREEDNTPPVIGTGSKVHDLFFYEDSNIIRSRHAFISDNEWNLKDTFTFYWTPYKESWGNRTDILTDIQISALENTGTGYFETYYGIDSTNPPGLLLCEAPYICIPKEGFSDGDYMLFAKIEDKYNNYRYTTLGKIHIGSFKKDLQVSYDKNNKQLNISLDLQPGETFEKNKIICEYYYYDSTNNEVKWYWYNNDKDNENDRNHKRKDMLVDGNKLVHTQKILSAYYKKDENNKNNGSWTTWEPLDRFVKCYVYSYNEDETTGLKFDITNDNKYDTDRPGYNSEAYDTETDETFSNIKYMFIPDANATADALVCKTKYFASNNGYSPILLCDKPVLVEYITSSRDLGNNINEWEKRGNVIYSMTYNDLTRSDLTKPTCDTLTQLDTSMVFQQEGSFYYVVTVHFVDGTSDMSVVYRK